MKNYQEQLTTRLQFIQLCRNVAAIKLEELTRSNLGEINFELGEILFKYILNFFETASKCNWDDVPLQSIFDKSPSSSGQPFQQELQNFQHTLNSIRTFTVLSAPNPQERKNAILEELESSWRRVYSVLSGLVAYQVATDNDVKAAFEHAIAAVFKKSEAVTSIAETQIENALSELKENAAKLTADLAETKIKSFADQKAINEVLQSVRSAGEEIGVTEEAIHFDKLARKYFWVALSWLAVAVVFGICAFWYAVIHLPEVSATNLPDLVKLMAPRLIVISLFLTGLFFCLKNFSAVSHNQIINRHRQTSLSTFKTFVASTKDAQMKNAVLLQATKAIFLPQPSGYLKGETDSPQMSQITEVVRGLNENTLK